MKPLFALLALLLGTQTAPAQGLPGAVEVYAAKFSAEDLHGLLEFYATPLGKRLIAAQPQIAQQMFQLGSAWGQRTAQAALAKHAEELRKRGFKL
ncbi:MAG: DUF2059 domain-containing protein [Alphaproteobacteria bacterium]|nr:DUF2059 domain-containing protein [Alphaproteobacteria bacterium]